MKGGRLSRIRKYIDSDIFMMTYGDGIGNVNLKVLLKYHLCFHNKIATVTGVRPISRFGEINHEGGLVTSFSEKPKKDGCLINGGFFVFNKRIFDYLNDAENCDLEVGPLEQLAKDQELMVYKHEGFWRCMDTLNEMIELDNMWREGKAKWKIWDK
jgi:glucose-1-phosphate cytidylyltransferase